jgi:UrcA family protein
MFVYASRLGKQRSFETSSAALHLDRKSVPPHSDHGKNLQFTQLSANFHPPLIQRSCSRAATSITWESCPGEYFLKEIVMKSVIKTQSQLAKSLVAAGFFALASTAIGGQALADQPAAASVPRELVTYPVGYSDLDVSKLKGAKTLYLRIRYAAETLCQNAATWGKKEGEACMRKAIDDAVARVNVPLLTQYYELRSKRDKAGLVQLAKAN